MSDHLILYSRNLLSKFGFNDGDVPDIVADWLDEPYWGGAYDWEKALTALVRTYLLPELQKNHEIELVDVDTIHNPVRAAVVDGYDVDWRAGEHPVELKPEYVEIPMSVVIEELERTL